MAIRVFSDVTGKYYDNVEDAKRAEMAVRVAEEQARKRREQEEAEKKAAAEKEAVERKEAAARVEAARKVMVDAQNGYRAALDEFIKKYHTYHYSTSDIKEIPTLFDIFNFFS